MQITSGIVMYSRVVKDDDYGIKREAKVELSFMVAEGEEPDVDRAKDLAVAKVHEMLRVKPATKSEPAAVPNSAGSPLPAHPGAAAVPAPANDKAKLAAAAAEKATPKEAPAEKPEKAPAKKKPVPAIEQRQISTGEERKDPNDMSELFGEEEEKPREITDKELNEEVQKKVAALKSSAQVLALKKTYVGEMPKTVRDIPQDKRAQFLKDMKALT